LHTRFDHVEWEHERPQCHAADTAGENRVHGACKWPGGVSVSCVGRTHRARLCSGRARS
jgi:hypothetical protein